MKKNSIFFNMGHILHQLDNLIDVIWVILSKKKNTLHWLFLRTDIIYSFLPYFKVCTAHSRVILLCHVIITSAASNVFSGCQYIMTLIFINNKYLSFIL